MTPEVMQLAKPCLDVAVMTDRLEESRAFWEGEVGLSFEETLYPRKGMAQHRFEMHGSVMKVNVVPALPANPPSGIRELWIARSNLREARELCGPGGERVRLVPKGQDGIEGIGVSLVARDPSAHAVFYRDVLGFEERDGAFWCGTTRLAIRAAPEAPADADVAGPGYRYLTVQIRRCDAAHRYALAQGVREGAPPRQAGDIAIYSMVRDPDGNWVELSQRASLTGPLDSPADS